MFSFLSALYFFLVATAAATASRNDTNRFHRSLEEIDYEKIKSEAQKWRKMSSEILCDKLLSEHKSGAKYTPVLKTGSWCLMRTAHSHWWPKALSEIYGPPAAGHVPADTGLATTMFQQMSAYERDKHGNSDKVKVFDIGAGVGQYGRWLAATPEMKHISWKGFDGAGNIEQFTNGFVNWIDVTDPLYDTIGDGAVADWVMSLEVGEHIPHNSTDAFMSLLAKHSRHGAVLSWALRGQGGNHHINEMNNDEIVERMEKHGFVQNDFTQRFQQEGRTNAKLWWFKKSFMAFVKKAEA